jgi:hypothetical protein
MSTKFEQLSGDSEISEIKKTVISFPGLTRGFKDKSEALDY